MGGLARREDQPEWRDPAMELDRPILPQPDAKILPLCGGDRVPSDLEAMSGTSGFEIRADDLTGREIGELLAEHLCNMAEVTPRASMHALGLDELRKPGITFWTLWRGKELAGCGALKEIDPEHGEIKSMRTAGAHLRKGIASKLLEHIIAEARRRGYRRLSLETGAMPYFEPARALYRKFGFTASPPFGDYGNDPNTVFMTLEIRAQGAGPRPG